MKRVAAITIIVTFMMSLVYALAACTYDSGGPPHFGAVQNLTLGGDLDGGMISQRVVGIEGNPLAPPPAGEGGVAIEWDGAALYWGTAGGSVSPGSAGQLLATNDAGAATTWVYPHGDVDASATDPGELTVNAIQGFGVSTTSPSSTNVLAYSSGLWRPTALTTSNITSGTAGQVMVTNSSPASAWTSLISYETTHGRFTSGNGGSDYLAAMGPLPGSETSYGAFWALPHGTSLSGSNYTFLSNGSSAYLNAPSGTGNVVMQAGTTQIAAFQPAAQAFEIDLASVFWPASITAPSITQTAAASDVATQNLTIQAQAPYASAVTHVDAGDVIVNTPASISGSSKYGGFQIQGASTPVVRMGQYATSTSFAAIWFVDGGSPSSTNYGFLGNQSATYLNAPSSSANLYLLGGNNVMANLIYTSATMALGGTIGSAPLQFYWGGNAPTIQTGTSATSLTIGTDKSAAALQLQGDAAANVAKLTTSFEHQTFVAYDSVSTPGAPASTQRNVYVDASNRLVAQDNLGNITVLAP